MRRERMSGGERNREGREREERVDEWKKEIGREVERKRKRKENGEGEIEVREGGREKKEKSEGGKQERKRE